MNRLIATVVLMLLFGFPPAAAAETGMTPCTLIPLWSPQAQFAGYYVALDKGIYRKHGLDMVILKGGPGCSAPEYLKEGLADFAVMWLTTAIQQYDEGIRLVHLSQIVPRSSMMLVAKKSRNIRTPADMKDKKVGIWGGDFAIPPKAFFKIYGLGVKEIPQSYTVNLFLRGGVDVASAMWYNEYHTILNAGIDPEELDVFPLWDYGLNCPEDGLYMMEAAYRKNPVFAKAFVEASLEGWQYAFAHPDEALDIVIKYMREAKISANRTHQKWMLSKMQELIMLRGGKAAGGIIDQTDFDAVTDFLFQAGLIQKAPDYGEFTGEVHAED